jgi:hypothetical protein
MASTKYAQAVLRKAGEQWANRLVIVEKKAPGLIHENAHGKSEVKGKGAITPPSWQYTGASCRLSVTDPHDAALCVCLVYHFLKGKPRIWRAVFMEMYVQGRFSHRLRREESLMLKALGEYIGEVPNEQTIVDSIMREHRLAAMKKEREMATARERKSYANRKPDGPILLSDAQELATCNAA